MVKSTALLVMLMMKICNSFCQSLPGITPEYLGQLLTSLHWGGPSVARLQLGIDSVRFVTQGVWSTFAVNLLEGCEGQARVVLFKTSLTLATKTFYCVYCTCVFPNRDLTCLLCFETIWRWNSLIPVGTDALSRNTPNNWHKVTVAQYTVLSYIFVMWRGLKLSKLN